MEKNNIAKEVVTTTRVKTINYYAALAIALITTIVAGLFVGLSVMLIEAANISYEFQSIVGSAAFFADAALFFGLPVLLNSKYRWKTILVTIIFQSIILFISVFIISMIFGQNQQDNSQDYYNDAVVGPQINN